MPGQMVPLVVAPASDRSLRLMEAASVMVGTPMVTAVVAVVVILAPVGMPLELPAGLLGLRMVAQAEGRV